MDDPLEHNVEIDNRKQDDREMPKAKGCECCNIVGKTYINNNITGCKEFCPITNSDYKYCDLCSPCDCFTHLCQLCCQDIGKLFIWCCICPCCCVADTWKTCFLCAADEKDRAKEFGQSTYFMMSMCPEKSVQYSCEVCWSGVGLCCCPLYTVSMYCCLCMAAVCCS